MAWFFSAGHGADHVDGELESEDHQVDCSDPENYLNAPQSCDLRLRTLSAPDREAAKHPPDRVR